MCVYVDVCVCVYVCVWCARAVWCVFYSTSIGASSLVSELYNDSELKQTTPRTNSTRHLPPQIFIDAGTTDNWSAIAGDPVRAP